MSDPVKNDLTDDFLSNILKFPYVIVYGNEEPTIFTRKESRRNYDSFIKKVEKWKNTINEPSPLVKELIDDSEAAVLQTVRYSTTEQPGNNVFMPRGNADVNIPIKDGSKEIPNIKLVGDVYGDINKQIEKIDELVKECQVKDVLNLSLMNEEDKLEIAPLTLICINPNLSEGFLSDVIAPWIDIPTLHFNTILITHRNDYPLEFTELFTFVKQTNDINQACEELLKYK